MTQETEDHFAERMKDETRRMNAARGAKNPSMFIAVVDSKDADTPFTERYQFRKGANTADSNLRRDNIVDALKEGTAEVKNREGQHVGWENNRLDLLLDSENRRLLDILPYAPSREQTLANIIRRECRNMSEEEQYELACLDRNIDKEAIRPMLMENAYKKKSVEQKVPSVDEQMKRPDIEAEVKKVVEQYPVIDHLPKPSTTFQSYQEFREAMKTANEHSTSWLQPQPQLVMAPPVSPCPMPPSYPQPAPQPLNLPFMNTQTQKAPAMQERTVTLSCPIGRYRFPVLDIVQNAGYIVIIQKEDASLLVSFEANHTTYRIDAVDADLEFSGISFRFNGAVFTVMVTK